MESKLHSIFRYRNFQEIPPNCDPDLFLAKNSDNQSCLHVAATCGGFDYIPPELLTAENLRQRDSFGDTPIHLAAFVGKLHALPLEVLPKDIFYAQDGDGKSVIAIAREKGILPQIPISVLLANEAYQYEAILNDLTTNRITKIDHRLMNPSIWSRTSSGERDHQSLFDTSAELGLLDQLPAEMLLEDVLKSRNHYGETPLHVVAKSLQPGSLGRAYSRFPEAFDWTDMDSAGNTILHCAARSGQLASVPDSILTEEAVTIRNHDGDSVLDLAFETKCLEVVPVELRFLCDDYSRTRLSEVLTSGDCEDLPKSLLLFSSLQRLLPTTKDISSILQLAARKGTLHMLPPEAFNDEYLKVLDDMGLSPLHIAAANGSLENLPAKLLTYEQLSVQDKNGRTPCHVAISSGHFGKLPFGILSPALLLTPDNEGVTCFHFGAAQQGLGGIPISLFSREALLAVNKTGQSVADIIEEHGNTPLLPPHLRNLSKERAFVRLKEGFSRDFTSAAGLHARELAELITLGEFQLQRRNFVLEWSGHYPELSLDEEQAEAVAEYGPHVQVVARAGSGKTRTLVARALFQITHCRIPATSILILAFNKKAVEEIRERLSKYLSEEQMPHVLTFHALAHRIVKPAEDLIFDEGETKEGQVFSTTIQRIIDEEMRGGAFEAKLRELMEARWKANLERIIALGFNLPQDEFLAHRANLPLTTMNARRVDTEAHKHIGNALLHLSLRYSYRRAIHRAAGTAYAPDFSHYNKETDQRIVVELLGQDGIVNSPARQAFWNSDRASNAHLLQFTEADCQDPGMILELVEKELAVRGIAVSPMSDDELWLALRDDVIRDFTKAVKNFISRCQKELISPDLLDGMLPDSDPELWSLNKIGENRYIKEPTVEGMQVRFWRLCSEIYRRYRQVLNEQSQTDFDQLMLNAAGTIREGNTGFSSARGRGDIRQIRHLLIDEYQDFSHLFDELRKSIIAQSPEALFFCVGDDWQAINKFAGSDLRYFTGFTQTFEPSVRKLITRNYRSCRKIVEIGNRVMQGEGEPSVPNSNEQGNVWRVEVGDYGNLSEAEEVVIEELGNDALSILRIASDCTSRGESVAILSRTSSVATPEDMHKLERWQERLRSFLPEKNRELLEASTTHGYKGKEAEIVILLDPEAYPFVHPDSIFNTIFGDTFQSIEDDEKRLFYVGVTRPKKTLYLLSYPSRYSDERPYSIRFLANAYPPSFDINRLQSNLLCGSRVVVRLTNRPGNYGNGGTFPIKDKLKESKFKWNEDRKIWSIFLERGSINSPFECVQYLNAQPWVREADDIVATFAWEDQKHRMVIDGGRVTPEGSSSPLPQIHGSEKKSEHTEPVDRIEQTQPKNPPPSDAAGQTRQQNPVATSAGVFETGVVGMKYGSGMEKARHLSVGDFVRLQREPGNPHDENAIQVMTASGERIGYVSRHVAEHLAAGLDAWGGTSQAKVTSVWIQPPPNFMVSIQICFPLPPNVVIPHELDANAQLADSPFGSAKPITTKSSAPTPPAKEIAVPEPVPLPPENHTPHDAATEHVQPGQEALDLSENLSPQQRLDLEGLLDPRLGPLIAEMYLSGLSDWPQIGYEGKDANGICTGSMLEVAWLDFKIGIALPANEFRSLAESGWTVLPAATVTASELRSLFSAEMTEAHPADQSSGTNPSVDTADSKDFTDKNIRFRHGSFYDEEPDEDIPPF
jgi:DNA helicase-4